MDIFGLVSRLTVLAGMIGCAAAYSIHEPALSILSLLSAVMVRVSLLEYELTKLVRGEK